MPILQDNIDPTAGQPQATMPPEGVGAPAAPEVPGGALPQPNPQVTCPAVKAHMQGLDAMRAKMNPKQGDAYDRVVMAGKRTLYAEQTAPLIKKMLEVEDSSLGEKLGQSVAGLMVMMDNQANGAMPKEIMVPAGVAILFEAGDYLFEIGEDVSEEVLGDGLEAMIYSIYDAFKIPPEQVDKAISALADKLGFKDEGNAMDKIEDAQDEGVIRQPIPAEDAAAAEEEGFQQGFNNGRGV